MLSRGDEDDDGGFRVGIFEGTVVTLAGDERFLEQFGLLLRHAGAEVISAEDVVSAIGEDVPEGEGPCDYVLDAVGRRGQDGTPGGVGESRASDSASRACDTNGPSIRSSTRMRESRTTIGVRFGIVAATAARSQSPAEYLVSHHTSGRSVRRRQSHVGIEVAGRPGSHRGGGGRCRAPARLVARAPGRARRFGTVGGFDLVPAVRREIEGADTGADTACRR